MAEAEREDPGRGARAEIARATAREKALCRTRDVSDHLEKCSSVKFYRVPSRGVVLRVDNVVPGREIDNSCARSLPFIRSDRFFSYTCHKLDPRLCRSDGSI